MHAIDCMRADIREPLTLLLEIEIPGRPKVGHACDLFEEVVHTDHRHARLGGAPGRRVPKHLGVFGKQAGQGRGHLVSAAHHVGEDEPPLGCQSQG